MKFTRLNLRNRERWTTVCVFLILSVPFFVKPYVVSGGSMEPTYHEGEMVVAESITPHFHVWRGEVLVIRNPHDKNVIEIKRVVGLPGEHVALGQTGVIITQGGRTATYGMDTAVGGVETGAFEMKLGPEDYMVLGDNRSKSSDSRTFGAVQEGDIIGHVILGL